MQCVVMYEFDKTSRDNIKALIINEKIRDVTFSKDDYTIHQVVHCENFGAKRPNVSRLKVCALVFSLSLSS